MLLEVDRVVYYEITYKNKSFETIINVSNSSVKWIINSQKWSIFAYFLVFLSYSCKMLLEVVRVVYYEITHKNKSFETIIDISF